MANENKEIGEIVKKCSILLLDIEGTTTSISFVKDKLFPYAEENVKQFLDSQWETEDVKDAVSALRKLAIQDQEGSVEGVVSIPGEDASKEDQIEGLVSSVKWQMSADRKAGPLKQLQGLIWKQGYDSGDIKGHVYDDVSAALEAWHSTEGQKVYIYSSGSVQAQKLLFGQSLAGDLLRFIDGHFDTTVGAKQDAASYKNIVEKIGCKADEVLFLTDIVKEAEAAREAGVHAALVSREGNAPLPAAAAFPVLHSLAELAVSNKRKPEPQEEETPAKVPKTDVESSVKTAPEAEVTPKPEAASKETPEQEKMEVEENVSPTEQQKANPIKEQVIVEEMDSNEASSLVSVCDLEPVVEEKEDKAEEKETEKKEAENNGVEPKGKEAPTVVTEIEEISEKQLPDVADIVEDIVPVVEEPMQEDLDELQNVGDVLEKECDDILAKVHDVTNLDSIPVKSLATIAEDTMETENTDTNDIVDRILDTELDLEMKQCSDIDLNTVTEITDETKTEVEKSKETSQVTNETKDEPAPAPDVAPGKTEGKDENEEKKEVVEESAAPQETKGDEQQITETDKKETIVEKTPAEITKSNDKVETNVAETTTEPKPVEEKKESVPEPPTKEKETTPAEEAKLKVETTELVAENGTTDKEPQLNGKATNGNSDPVSNGDAGKDEELSARLSVENGKVNGSNGDAQEEEKGQGDCKAEEVVDIKVKSVPTGEPRTDPIEQPTQA